MFKVLVVLSVALYVANAWQALAKLEEKPEKFKNQEGCYIKDLEAVIPFGQSAPSKKSCSEYSCGREMVSIEGCGAVGTQPPCVIVTDSEKPYPKCCPRIKCP